MIRTITATLAATTLAGAVSAADTVVIDVTDVDFSDPAQAATVYERIVAASEEVCADMNFGSVASHGALSTQRYAYAQCVTLTIAEAVDEANRPALSREHAAQDVETFEVASQ